MLTKRQIDALAKCKALVDRHLARMRKQGIVLRGAYYVEKDGRKIPVVTFEDIGKPKRARRKP
jgi:hypothetical protein